MKTASLLLTALLLAASLPLSAAVPQIINYQGRIAVGSTPFTGTGQFRFALVNGTGTTTYWSNDGSSTAGSEPTAAVSLPVVNGLYIVPLGDATLANMTAIPATVFANDDVRVRVWFNDGSTGSQMLSPDQRITSVGYALMAQQAQSVPDGSITAAKLAPGITINGNVTGNASTSTQGTALIGTLQSPGTINQAFNPVDWTQLKGVPPGFADGTDAVGVTSITAGNGLTGGTITGSGTIALSGDVPLKSNSLNNFSGDIFANSFLGNGSNLNNLDGARLQSGSVPLSALASNARPKYDRQEVKTQGNVSVTATLADVSGMTLTTKNLSEPGNYQITFRTLALAISGGPLHAFINVNGTDIPTSESYFVCSNGGDWVTLVCTATVSSLPAGSIIKARGKVFSGSGIFEDPQLIIDGVPTSQVVP